MFLSNLSIKRPVLATVMILALVTLGLFSFRRLAIDMMPDVEIPVLSITTEFPGASPETVEREVTKRIEEAVNPISGVKHVQSVSRECLSSVIVEFQLEVKINDVWQEARAKINAIRRELAEGMKEPVIQKFDFNAMPIISLGVRSNILNPRDLSTLAGRKIKRRLESIAGVAKAKLVGSSKREVAVNLDPARLDALGMGVNEVVAGLQSENVNTPLGRLNRGDTEMPLRVSGKPVNVDEYPAMVIAHRGVQPITLGDIATVVDGVEEQRTLALINGEPAVALDITKQTKANTVEVVDAVKRAVAELANELPTGTEIQIVRDSSVFIRDSVRDVQTTLVLGGLLTIVIVFCFLNSWRSTVITGLTLPISVISSFIVMYFLNMTLNTLTLMALSLAIGLLIDDAIVVRENIVRHLEHGEDHLTAARNGTSEIGLAVIATSMSIIAVFVPVAFMKGIIGRFFFQFGLTVAFAVLVSLFVSFTLDPMLSSRWYDPDIERKGARNFLQRWLDGFNAAFERTADRYKQLVGWALDHRVLVVGAAALAFVAGLGVFALLQSEFMTPMDQGEFVVRFKTAPGSSIVETRARLEQVLKALAERKEVKYTYASIGAGDADTVRDAMVFVKLVDRSERKTALKQFLSDERKRLERIPGIELSVQEDPDAFQKPLQIAVRGDDIPTLKRYAGEIKKELYTVPGIVDLEASMEQDLPEYRLLVDRQRAAATGLGTNDVANAVGVLVGGQAVSTYEDETGEAVDVRLRLPAKLRQDVTQVGDLRISVPGKDGTALVPLADLVTFTRAVSPAEISRRDLARQVVIDANLDNLPLGTAGEVAPADLRGRNRARESDEIGERHERRAILARDRDPQIADLGDVLTQLRRQAQAHVDRFAGLVLVGGDRLAADQNTHRVRHVVGPQASCGGALPVHQQAVLRQVLLHRRLEVHDAGHRVQLLLDLAGVALERRDIVAADGDLQRLLERVRVLLHRQLDAGDPLEALALLAEELLQCRLALAAVDELDEDHRIADGVRVAGADRGVGVLHLLTLGERLEHLLESGARLDDRGSRRCLEANHELALIHRRHELALQQGEHAEAGHERQGRRSNYQDAVIERPPDQLLVAIGGALEGGVETVQPALQEVAGPFALDVGVVPARRQHRVERE